MNPNRVLLMQLSQRTSAKGNRYLSGWLGKASVVAFQAEEPDKWGNPVWDLFVSTPEPRPEAGQEPARRPQARNETIVSLTPEQGNERGRAFHINALAKPSPRPQDRGDAWRGSAFRRPANGASRAPQADAEPFYEDSL